MSEFVPLRGPTLARSHAYSLTYSSYSDQNYFREPSRNVITRSVLNAQVITGFHIIRTISQEILMNVCHARYTFVHKSVITLLIVLI